MLRIFQRVRLTEPVSERIDAFNSILWRRQQLAFSPEVSWYSKHIQEDQRVAAAAAWHLTFRSDTYVCKGFHRLEACCVWDQGMQQKGGDDCGPPHRPPHSRVRAGAGDRDAGSCFKLPATPDEECPLNAALANWGLPVFLLRPPKAAERERAGFWTAIIWPPEADRT